MSYRYHGRAQVSTTNPSAWAACDRCGILYNRRDLIMDRQWTGAKILDRNRFVCKKCLDGLQPQLRTIVLPPDPPGIERPAVEPYPRDERVTVRATMNGGFRALTPGAPACLRIIQDASVDL